MLSEKNLKSKLLETFGPRNMPVEINVTGGTNVDKFLTGMKYYGVFEDYNHYIDKRYYTQINSELKKLAGDKSLSRILHKVNFSAEWNDHDSKLLEKEIDNPALMNDHDKMWNSRDYDTLESLLDIFFDNNSPLYVTNCLNESINALLEKYKNEPINYESHRYTNRSRIGTYIMTPIANKMNYNIILNEFAKPYFNEKGFGVVPLNAGALKDDGYNKGKHDLDAYINNQIGYVNDEKLYPNGVVVLAPGWSYAARSMTTTYLDVALNLKNTLNPQDADRVMTGKNKGDKCTLDGKEKLIGLTINSSFVKNTNLDYCEYQCQVIRELQAEQMKVDPTHDPLGIWIRGINIFRRLPGAGYPTLTQDNEIKDILQDSDRLYRNCLDGLSHTNQKFWNNKILNILEKLIINRSTQSYKKLFEKIKKKLQKSSTKKIKNKKTADPIDEMKTMIAYIMKVLIGSIGLMKGIAVKEKVFTVRECLKHISEHNEYALAFKKNVGITPEEYITLLNTDGLPESNMNYLLQGFIQELHK